MSTDGYSRYAAYKPSGNSSLGEVPANWQVSRIAHVFVKSNAGEVIDKSYWGDGAELLYTCNRTPMKSDFAVFPQWKRTVINDLLLTRNGTPYVHKPTEGAIYSNVVQRITLADQFSREYLSYCLRNSALGMRGYGVSIESFNFDNWKSLRFAHPPVEEQTQIANFLDYETAKIDALIEKQQQLIALLKEKRQAVISHAVTKGLTNSPGANLNAEGGPEGEGRESPSSPDLSAGASAKEGAPACAADRPMRDSGVEWLGEVPAHWTVGRYKFCTTRVVVGIAEAATHAYSDEGVPIIRSTNIKEEGLYEGGLLYIEPWFAEQNESKFLYAGDVVTVRTGYPGVSAVVPTSLNRSQCFTNLVATPKKQCDARFLCEFLNSHFGKKYFELLGWGSAQKNISVPILQNVPVAWPSTSEQQEIVSYVDQQNSRFSALISSADNMVSVLQERRTALISAAVTGKIDVRGWRPPESQTDTEVV